MDSRWDKYLKWCKTKSGKTVCNRAFVALNIGVFSALYLPQTFLLKKYQNLFHLYKDGKPADVPESIKSLFNEVLDDLKIHEIDRKFIKPFMAFGFDTFQAGINNTRTGGIIGIPINFTYSTPRDIEPSRLLINAVPANWSRQETEDLVQALILSRDAQKFAIAREIRTFQESSKILDCTIASVLFISSYTFCQWIKNKYDMYKKSLGSRVFLYTAAGFAGVALYFTQKDFFKRNLEENVDEELAKLSPNYTKGGHEFYSKLLQRNIAHRRLLENHGKELFNEDGNPAYYIRQKTTPITKRKSLFETKLKEFLQEQQKALNSDLKTISADLEKA